MKTYETKVYDYIDKETGQHIIKACTMYAGKTVYAVAKCDPQDTFNYEFGEKLALLRLDQKIAQKRASSMKNYVKFCERNLELLEIEHRRVKKALERAIISYGDRRVEAQLCESHIAEMCQ